MKPDPAAPADQLNLLRQQLILAQVRLMELEDVRDELSPKLVGTEKLLAAAQTLADQKVDEAGHLARVLADLQAQQDHLRHLQHVANEALAAARIELAAAEQRGQTLQTEIVALADQSVQLQQTLGRLGLELAESATLAATRLERISQLDAEVRAMKTARSWRWTAWLRSLERLFGGRKS